MFPDRKARGRRGLRAALLLATVIAGVLFGATPGRSGNRSLGSPAAARADVPARAPGKPPLGPNQADVTISRQAQTKAIPKFFLGFSTEYSTLPLIEEHPDTWVGVVGGVLTNIGGDQVALRIGGDSAAHVTNNNKPIIQPWEIPFNGKLVQKAAKVFEGLQARVIIDINAVTSKPKEVGRWMRALINSAHLRQGKIVAFEIGNEPDIYDCNRWGGGKLQATDHSTRKEPGCPPNPPDLPKHITAKSYANNYRKYARALHSVAPKVPLMAPALSMATKNLGWIKTLLHRPHPGLRVISAHVYPYSACDHHPWQPHYPTIPRILSENATAGMVRTIRPALALAHNHGLSLRLTEVNSVTCGGRQGVSNTFATALWAPDALFELMNAGVEGVQLHARLKSINRPFSFNRQGLQTRPLLYGLSLFTSMLGPNARLVPVQLSKGSRSLHLKVWAVRELVDSLPGNHPVIQNPLEVLVINKGPSLARITLHLPTSDTAYVVRLRAPKPSSTSDVTWGGGHFDHQAILRGQEKPETLTPRNGSYVLRVRRYSAAVLAVHVAASTLAGRPKKAAGPALFGYEGAK